MATEYRYLVSSYKVTLLANSFGWIELFDGTNQAGYIYFNSPTAKDDFGALGTTHPYMITTQPA